MANSAQTQQLTQQQIQNIVASQQLAAQAQAQARVALMQAQADRERRERQQPNIASRSLATVQNHIEQNTQRSPVQATVASMSFKKFRSL